MRGGGSTEAKYQGIRNFPYNSTQSLSSHPCGRTGPVSTPSWREDWKRGHFTLGTLAI